MKLIFAGTPDFAASALAALLPEHEVVAVYTQPDRPSGRGMQLTPSPVKQLAVQHDIPVLQPVTLKDPAAQQELAAFNADVMVVAAYGLILPKAVLDLPKYGCLNIHASLLPRWRGAAPIQRAIQAGDAETGITIMQMDVGLDTGDMLLKKSCAITQEDTTQTLHDKLASMGAVAIVEALQELAKGKLQPEPQDNALATYAAKISKTEALLDWSLPAGQLSCSIRAYNPFPAAYTFHKGTQLKIWQAKVVSARQAEAGTVLEVDKQGITVACGKDALMLQVLQRPNGKALPVSQFIQGYAIQAGDRFTAG